MRNVPNIILIDSLVVITSRTEETFDSAHYMYFPPEIPLRTILRCSDGKTRTRVIGDAGTAVAKLLLKQCANKRSLVSWLDITTLSNSYAQVSISYLYL